MKDLIDIFFTSARVGAMTFGGGYAMLPILQKEVVEKKNGIQKKKFWTTTHCRSACRDLSW